MQDSFFFSKVCRGAMILNDLQITKEDLFMTLLFKIHINQIKEELDLLN